MEKSSYERRISKYESLCAIMATIDAASFIASNFPSEVKEAYDALIPGAFKADFFRYCILFIHGGVYADIDILCTCDLDSAIDSDVSFLVPIDLAPGKNGNSCLWNGFIASAPGHP
jgi:mannosyltransferase OCH1-like enzyme